MSRRALPWISGFLLSMALGSAAVPAFAAEDWKAVAASGLVTARGQGTQEDAWQKVVRGSRLPPLSEVRTGRRGRATLASHASVLIVDPESEIDLPATPTAADGQRLFQGAGSVVYEVDGSKVSGFRVVTPYLVAGVKGTVFLVTVKRRYTSVTVERGVLEVASVATDERAEIHAGETALARAEAEEGAAFEVVRPRGAEKESGQASHEARRIARDEVEKLQDDDTDAVPSHEKEPPADDCLDDVRDPLDDLTDSLEDELDRLTEETEASDSKQGNGTRTN